MKMSWHDESDISMLNQDVLAVCQDLLTTNRGIWVKHQQLLMTRPDVLAEYRQKQAAECDNLKNDRESYIMAAWEKVQNDY